MPALVALTFALGPRLMNQRSEPVRGQIVVIDPTGRVAARTAGGDRAAGDCRAARRRGAAGARRRVRRGARPCRSERRRLARRRRAHRRLGAGAADRRSGPRTEAANRLRAAKAWLTDDPGGERHLAVVVVQRDAVTLAPGRRRVRRLRPVRAAEPRRPDRDRHLRQRPRGARRARAPQAQHLDRQERRRADAGAARQSVTVSQGRRAADRRRLQPRAAVRVRRPAAVQRADGRPGAGHLDGRGKVEPRDRGAAVGGLAVRAARRQDPRPDGRSAWWCSASTSASRS